MKIKDIAEKIESIAPLALAQNWDNVGLLIGDPDKKVRNILLTIDVTKDVLAEAKKWKTDLIISYHPLIWDPLKKITTEQSSSIVYKLIQSDIAVFSMHTALDVVVGGVNDELAEIIGIKNPEPIGDFVENPTGQYYKLVVFVPVESLRKVANAIFKAGAGAIGNYRKCSFQSEGTGSFLPEEGAKPAIGEKGRFEEVKEIRFGSIVPANKLNDVVTAMKKAHPYETPAFDCYLLHNPQEKTGLGRIGKLETPAQLSDIIQKLKKHTKAKMVGIVGKENRKVKTAAVCAGACGKIITKVLAADIDLYVTGELKHHYALDAKENNLTCICLTHSVSERFILKKFAKQLKKLTNQVKIRISKKDKDPFNWKQI